MWMGNDTSVRMLDRKDWSRILDKGIVHNLVKQGVGVKGKQEHYQ